MFAARLTRWLVWFIETFTSTLTLHLDIIYKSVVRPCLEYWNPHQLCLKAWLIEQLRNLLSACLKSWNTSNDQLISMAEMTPFEVHCARSKLSFAFMILHKLSYTPDGLFVPSLFCTSNCLNHTLTTTRNMLFSAVSNMTNLWTSLPF